MPSYHLLIKTNISCAQIVPIFLVRYELCYLEIYSIEAVKSISIADFHRKHQTCKFNLLIELMSIPTYLLIELTP